MKDIDERLRTAQPAPRRQLSTNFTAKIVTELKMHPGTPEVRQKESLFMKLIHKPAMVLSAIFAVIILGGSAYAITNPEIITRFFNKDAGKVESSRMMQRYETYVNEVRADNPKALSNFLAHSSEALEKEIDTTQGYDLLLCAQNAPNSVAFERIDGLGTMTAVNMFDGGETVKVELKYDNQSGKFTDVSCPAPQLAKADAYITLTAAYDKYVNDINKESLASADTAFYAHVTPDLQATLKSTVAFNPIVCAQNLPSSVRFEKGPSGLFTAVTSFSESPEESTNIVVSYDTKKGKITNIACPAPNTGPAPEPVPLP